MPSAADLTPEEVAAVLAARRQHVHLEDEMPASFAARLDREIAVRVEAELAARGGGSKAKGKDHSYDGKAVGVASLIFGVPLMAIVEGTSHGNLGGAAIVMAGIALVNFAQAAGRRRH